ncbi:hypothetical protein BKA56DRAFT_619800 [Ilyonectria sp. MPI-CAGE-AT-0026]|nr:hypothetical protein BKA56DRAFT_619800 [Ilyonectria sp. MPI-CAGE-AT-0026]
MGCAVGSARRSSPADLPLVQVLGAWATLGGPSQRGRSEKPRVSQLGAIGLGKTWARLGARAANVRRWTAEEEEIFETSRGDENRFVNLAGPGSDASKKGLIVGFRRQMLQPHGEDYWNIVLVVADSITYVLVQHSERTPERAAMESPSTQSPSEQQPGEM